MSTLISSRDWQTELKAPGFAEQVLAEPQRARRLLVECLTLVERELPFEVLPTLRWLQRELDAATETSARERLAEARLGCWKHLEACACHGVGTEVHAVRALLATLETLSRAPTAADVAEVVRLVQTAGARPQALAERLLGVLGDARAVEQAE